MLADALGLAEVATGIEALRLRPGIDRVGVTLVNVGMDRCVCSAETCPLWMFNLSAACSSLAHLRPTLASWLAGRLSAPR